MERLESKNNRLLNEADKQDIKLNVMLESIKRLEHNEKVTRELIDLLKEADMNLLEMVEEQKEYTDKLTRLIIDYNGRQTERIFNIYKMLVIAAIALWILFIVVILK